MAGIRERAEAYLKAVPEIGQITSKDGTGLFHKLTGLTQADLELNWNGGGIMTSCNAFVGVYATTLGSKKNLGCFDIDKKLAGWGKGAAWVPSGGDARPKYGDIFLLFPPPKPGKKYCDLHMGISLDFKGIDWTTAEGGQGGKNTGYDVIKRKHSTYPPSGLKGWVDLELYFDVGP